MATTKPYIDPATGKLRRITLSQIEAELDQAREEFKAARAQLVSEAGHVDITVDYTRGDDGEPREEHDISYCGDFVDAVIALKRARAHLEALELRQFEAANA